MARRKNSTESTPKPKKIKTSMRQKMLSYGVLFLGLLFLLSMFMTGPGGNWLMGGGKAKPAVIPPVSTPANVSGPQFKQEGSLSFRTAGDSAITRIDIEIADDAQQIEQGMMFRKSMKPDRGMLFIFPEEKLRNFWMKNCHFPLDMIFADKDKKVVAIQENTIPFSEGQIPSNALAKYVVEVNGGFSDAYGIKVGDYIDF